MSFKKEGKSTTEKIKSEGGIGEVRWRKFKNNEREGKKASD